MPASFISSCLLATIVLTGSPAHYGLASPSDYPSDRIPEHRRELRFAPRVEARDLTVQPGHSDLAIITPPDKRLPSRDLGRGNLRWTASDQNGISDHVAISDNGNIVAIGYSLNDERLDVRNAFGGDTLFTFRVESGGSYVAVSATGEIIAYAALDSVWLFRSNGRGVPFFRFGMNGYFPGPLALSPDGARLIATGNDPQNVTNRAWGFNTANGARLWTLEVDADEAYSWYGARISADGRVAVVNGKYRLFLLDAVSGDLIWEEPTYNTESAVELSGDGRILITGSLSGRLRVFGRIGQSYELLWHYAFTGAVSTWITSVAISRDGRTVAAGTLDFFADRYGGRYSVFETFGQGEPVWTSESRNDEISALDLTGDGGVLAAVSWGDINHEQPDLWVHERHSRNPIYTLTTNGSLAGVSLSLSGNRLIAGGKGTHNRVFGRGGQAHLVELTILGGFAAGRVSDQRNQPVVDATVGAIDGVYTTQTNERGEYVLRIETDREREFVIFADKRGLGRAEGSESIGPGDTTNNVNFQIRDNLVGPAPENLRASQGEGGNVVLTWDGYNGRRARRHAGHRLEILSAVGSAPDPVGATPWTYYEVRPGRPIRDDSDDADQILVYRSTLAGGPYTRIGEVDGSEERFVDRLRLFPTRRYYYRIAAGFEFGESEYSEEAVGWLDDDYLIWEADLESLPRQPRLDGSITAEEWEGSEFRDISDVFGYDSPDSAGSVMAWIGFRDQDDRLYVAVRYNGLMEVQENMGLGIYVDDDGDGEWSVRRPGSEGNYWGYWREGRPDMRYRSLSGGANAADPYHFANPTLAFGDGNRGVEVEMSIPLGFHSEQEVAVFAPERTIGLGLFAMHRDQAGTPIFDGWWPQNMVSIVSEPWQFARVHIPVTLNVPPLTPTGLNVRREGDGLRISWNDPEIGVDSARLGDWMGLNIYRNGEFLTGVEPGEETWLDREFRPRGGDRGGWFAYSIGSFVLDADSIFEGPRTPSVGAYLGAEPAIEALSHDDGSPEGFYVVDFAGEDNRFATRFTIPPEVEEASVFWIEFYHRGADPIDVWCAEDQDGQPSDEEFTRYRVFPTSAEGMERFHFPGLEQPRFEFDPDWGGSFWVVLGYLPTRPGSPAIGVDASASDGEINLYYRIRDGWRPFVLGQPMIRAGVGQPVEVSDRSGANIPHSFQVLANYPNPFNGRTFLPVRLPFASDVSINVTDLHGRVAAEWRMGELNPGTHIIPLNVADLSSGIYITGVDACGETRRITFHLLK